MFSGGDPSHQHPVPNQMREQAAQRSLKIVVGHSKESRDEKILRMRQISNLQILKYENVNYAKFAEQVNANNNPFTLLVTIFVIVDDFLWRQYVGHLEVLIKKFTNIVAETKGKILQEIGSIESNHDKLAGYLFQQRLETMLHLSNKQFQNHLLLLIHALIAYNKRYCLIDEALLSDHLTYRHSYQKHIRQDVLWLLTRMSTSPEAVNKVIRSYLSSPETTPLLPVLTIVGNLVYEQPCHVIEKFILTPQFQVVVQNGLLSTHMQTSRECVFVCNNLIFKSENCKNFLMSQSKLLAHILKLNNEEAQNFKLLLQSGYVQVTNMEEETIRA